MKRIGPQDRVLHFSFGDEPFGKASVFAGQFTKRQIANKSYKPLDPSVIVLPFKDKTFDIVYASHILQYVNHPVKILEEIKRISHCAHIREHSEFAEILFGWTEHKWIVTVENGILLVKEKTDKYGRFGSFFHQLYADDGQFYDYVGNNEGLFKIAVDWYEEDDEIGYIEIENEEEENEPIILGEIKEFEDEEEKEEIDEETQETVKVIQSPIILFEEEKNKTSKHKVVKTIFRPCQTEYFDYIRYELGTISDKIDVLNLKKENLL